jgi:hypothetical protein
MDEEEDDTSSFRPHMFDLSIKRSNSTPALPLLVTSTEYENIPNIFILFIFWIFLAMICNLMMWIFVMLNYVDIVHHL